MNGWKKKKKKKKTKLVLKAEDQSRKALILNKNAARENSNNEMVWAGHRGLVGMAKDARSDLCVLAQGVPLIIIEIWFQMKKWN